MLDVQRQKVIDATKVKSIITICYNVRKEIHQKLFKTTVSYSEEQCCAYKTLFANGFITKEEQVPNNWFRHVDVYENNKLVEQIWYENQDIDRRYVYSYDKEGNKVKEMRFEKTTLVEEINYTYNNHNDCIKYYSENYKYSERSVFRIESEWNYIENIQGITKRKVSKSFYKWKDKAPKISESEEVYIYDKKNNLINYKYYKDGKLVEVEEREYSNGKLVKTAMLGKEPAIRKYNEHGDLVYHKRYQYVSYNDPEHLFITSMEYKYDGYGNWIECRDYDENGDYSGLYTRQIEYIE